MSVGRLPIEPWHGRRIEERPAVAGPERPEPERAGVPGGEVRRRGEKDEVLERPIGKQGGVHGGQRAALGLSEEADLGGPRGGQNLLHRGRQVIEDQVIEPQSRVLATGDPEVEQVDVEALLHEVLHQAVARYQVQDVRLEHEAVDEEQRDRAPFAAGAAVAIEPRLVLGPHDLSGRGSGVDRELLRRTWVPVAYFLHPDRLRAVTVGDPVPARPDPWRRAALHLPCLPTCRPRHDVTTEVTGVDDDERPGSSRSGPR